MELFEMSCPDCRSLNYSELSAYQTKCDGLRKLLKCENCGYIFSETSNTLLFNLKTPVSRIAQVLKARTEGLSYNATCRTFDLGTNTLARWEVLFGGLKDTLMAYSLASSFIELVIEGDELYTKVHHNAEQSESEGWTVMLMDRASRFIWELSCGEKDKTLFMDAIKTLVSVIEHTDNLTLITDGERRYSNCLFQICHELVKNGKPGRPKTVLKKGVKARVKNKGSQSHKKGPKRPKYQTPKSEHPETKQDVQDCEIHANHCEGQNAATRRRNSAYRRSTNTYAKCKEGLQRTLDTYWVFHNFIKKHFSTKEVPAVKIGICNYGLNWREAFNIKISF
jgi:transposase-like protein